MKMYNLNLKEIEGGLSELQFVQGPSADINSDWANKQRK